ncbi:MAG: Gfo/Idh/MocA family oxidoreductase [Alphaproteobacteria bacterium]|nr:Gfo/Idh/MocA family oxidoreductase [Alphaproteobacteria bacterium]
MRVSFIGAGLQTSRRVPVVLDSADDELVEIVDFGTDQPSKLTGKFGCEWSTDWRRAIEREDVDAVVVCTPPDSHAEISIAAMVNGKHVLCEKPLCRTLPEADNMLKTAINTGRILKCGFNHRHHPAILDAHTRFARGDIGRLISARCTYGICGRPGFEKEWRADPQIAVGGQFAEQGVHAIDLFRWFLGELTEVSCLTSIGYFKSQRLEDNGMALFRSASGAIAMLHSSMTQWKNVFLLEFSGSEGYLTIDGLGATYGTERLLVGKRDFTAPFQDHIIEYRGGDASWRNEWREFKAAITEGREPIGSGYDGREALRLTLAAYESERAKVLIDLGTFGTGS